jgi:pyridoxal phosphate enzyme (YggS family)
VIDPAEVSRRAEAVRTRIREVGGDPETTEIVAVTKGHPIDAVHAAREAGLPIVGESYAQELVAKRDADGDDGLEWHFVGRLQRNKVKLLAGRVTCIHSVDRPALATEIARRAPHMAVYAQVNVSGEPQKGGCPPEEADELVATMASLDLEVRGLMTVATAGGDARAEFDRLAELASRLGLTGLSMGMSSDYEHAVAAGATSLRLGTALFGPRPP